LPRSESAGVHDKCLLAGRSTGGSDPLESLDGFYAFKDFTENDVAVVEPWGWLEGDKELGVVGVGAGVGHRQKVGLLVLEIEVLVVELRTIDRLATTAVSESDISTLGHELGNDSVELAVLEVEGLSRVAHTGRSVAQSGEVTGSLGDDVTEEAENDTPGLGTVNGDVEENLVSHGSQSVSC
jgi:hypothetical protein